MININRFLGELDADKDKLFKAHFIDSSYLDKIKGNESDIIYGLKGIGKTALRRALIELTPNNYFASLNVNLDTISFEALFKTLSTLNQTTGVEVSNLARSIWMNNLIHYGLESLLDKIDNQTIISKIRNILIKENFIDPNWEEYDTANRKIIAQIERFFDYVVEFGLDDSVGRVRLELNAKQYDAHNRFPLNPEINAVLKTVLPIIERSGRKVVICLDGFDSIADHTPESRKAIFSGLTDAIFRLSSDPLISEIFCYKAFLPRELTTEAESCIWDSDKYMYNEHHLKWSKNEIEKFLEKRLAIYSKKRYTKFSDLWLEYMPEKITNSIHNIEENTFEYILRHTLSRPRQILSHVQRIISKWDEKSTSFRVDPSFIPQIVAETNNELSRKVAGQLQKVYPNMQIQAFLKSWYNCSSVVTMKEFSEKLKTYFSDIPVFELNKIKIDLFNFGLFGICLKKSFGQQTHKKHFKFVFSEGVQESNILIVADENDFVALSPMFREFCNFNNSEYGIITTL